jgi:hypothetical protein
VVKLHHLVEVLGYFQESICIEDEEFGEIPGLDGGTPGVVREEADFSEVLISLYI